MDGFPLLRGLQPIEKPLSREAIGVGYEEPELSQGNQSTRGDHLCGRYTLLFQMHSSFLRERVEVLQRCPHESTTDDRRLTRAPPMIFFLVRPHALVNKVASAVRSTGFMTTTPRIPRG